MVNYTKIKSIESFEIDSKRLTRMTLISSSGNNTCKLVITDRLEKTLKVIEINHDSSNNDHELSTIEHQEFDEPWAICSAKQANSDEEYVYVGDQGCSKIFEFDYELNHKRTFNQDKLFRLPDFMLYDHFDNKLYATDWRNNIMTVWDRNDGVCVNSFEIDSPSKLSVNEKHLFVISAINYEFIKGTDKIKRIGKGKNCIFIMDKQHNYDIIHEIKIDNWLDPSGLHLTDNMEILTTAYLMDNRKSRSNTRYLFFIHNNQNDAKNLKLESIINIADSTFHHNSLFLCHNNSVEIIEFD